MRYIPNSPAEQAALLREVGAATVDDLFATVPREVFRKEPPPLAPPTVGDRAAPGSSARWP
jgi:glycine dehydrogenase (decarboxylating) alpha subunit (EC 1.4.4.2)